MECVRAPNNAIRLFPSNSITAMASPRCLFPGPATSGHDRSSSAEHHGFGPSARCSAEGVGYAKRWQNVLSGCIPNAKLMLQCNGPSPGNKPRFMEAPFRVETPNGELTEKSQMPIAASYP